ncbi:arylamine N-acetyltransferase, pineal gland isozyme NAT-10-like [Brachionichthys hirsutus]|uniref:arylamine N-acetyltransferase, pineal gland isozyme NAT-10-like n=1 Tax=Brachionichthys hirsutus TaxID=412623 RepID=UPI0036050C6F
MDVNQYLSRIGYSGPLEPTLDVLRAVHKCHLHSVPFENLTVHSGGRVTLELPLLYDKIVKKNRGGFCYELNGLFSWLLRELCFHVTLLSGQVKNEQTGSYRPPFDHLTLMVSLDGQRWLCDVGYGSRIFLLPLSLETSAPQEQGQRVYHIRTDTDVRAVMWKPEKAREDCHWSELYKFTLDPRRLEDFAEMCQYHQSSPCSLFYCKSICMLLKPSGTLVYIGRRLVSTTFPTMEITTRELKDEEIQGILAEQFGLVLSSTLTPKDEKIQPQPGSTGNKWSDDTDV